MKHESYLKLWWEYFLGNHDVYFIIKLILIKYKEKEFRVSNCIKINKEAI